MSIQQNFPSTRPSLNLNFARSQKLDPRITFTRTSSATRVNSDGLIEVVPANSPRFDFDPISGESLGLLVEEARTNLCRYGSNMDVFTSRSGGIITANSSISPDGSLTGTRFQGNGISAAFYDDNQSITFIAGKSYTFSVFAKANTTGEFSILLYDGVSAYWNGNSGSNNVVGRFNVISGEVLAPGPGGRSSTGPTLIEKYQNGWYRCSMTETCAITHTIIHQLIRTGSTSDSFFWGYQIEEGAFPTSYIPTTTSTVTRTQDLPRITGSNFSDFYNPSEGTFITEVTTGTTASTGADWFRATDGNANVNSIRLTRSGVGATPQLLISKNNVGQAGPFCIGVQANVFSKLGCYYKNNDFGITNNGSALSGSAIGTSGEVPDVNRLLIASPSTNGYIKRLVYYPSRLTNDQLITLTK
jgi:hypothetical protein